MRGGASEGATTPARRRAWPGSPSGSPTSASTAVRRPRRAISNLNVAGSGLFLSGLYARRPDVMALAVLKGAELAAEPAPGSSGPAALAAELQPVARLYAGSDAAPPFARLVSDLRLAGVFTREGVSSNATFEVIRPYLPPERAESAPGARDWEYLTDFLHHKLLLVDRRRMQLGGRNIEDSYHMRPNPMLDKYVFVDTDLYATLERGGEHVERAFEALWNFQAMVASTAEIRRHAPNDFVANLDAYGAASAACAATAPGPGREACVLGEFGRRAVPVAGREQQSRGDDAPACAGLLRAATGTPPRPTRRRRSTWIPGPWSRTSRTCPSWGAARRRPTSEATAPGTGRRPGTASTSTPCGARDCSTRAGPKDGPPGPAVVLHNAYFFPPSNLVETFGRMVNGDVDCRGASVVVLTNSAETTDLNVINLMARHSLKAFVDYLGTRRDTARSARFAIYEYRKFGGGDRISLHTKVSVLGDDVIVGSANADVRSYMMDSNNGFFVRRAPRFRQEYLKYLDGLMRDETKTRDMTAYYLTTPRATLLEEDRRAFRMLLAQYGADQLDPALQARLEQHFVDLLDLVYDLTLATLEGGRKGREKAAEFNRLFKPL